MLELINIKKDYPAGGGVVEALKGINLQFRESEFVSILGPSGCGKTTMLNIIGGLDQYTAGDLIINGKSTKSFHDRDWDTYRNHSIGFVFQSYNLIPHQTVLQNVELALTLSGVSKKERRARAKKALEEVGLSSQLNKKPSEMSGGQMQRVAIARALVNNPDIILADEPTGALDTETSLQVMEILKEISHNRLIVMVTHNPDLAEKYSTRIIRMLDGCITGDTAPLTEAEITSGREAEAQKRATDGKKKKPSMSFWTAFLLSLKNLFTKKGRTALTAFAGSIGIIGIALIFAVSNGMTTYIDSVQEETLSSYPLTLEAEHMDLGKLLETFSGAAQSAHDHDRDAVYQKSLVYDLVNSLNSLELSENDLKSFKKYLETQLFDPESGKKLQDALSGVQYTYDLDLLVYTESADHQIIRSDTEKLTQELIAKYMGMSFAGAPEGGATGGGNSTILSMFSSGNTANRLWQELLPGIDGKPVNDLLYKQYDVVAGSWPSAYNEIVIVLDQNNELDDLTLYALGLKTQDEVESVMRAVASGEEAVYTDQSWSYDEICGMEFRVILNSDCYMQDETSGLWMDLRDSEAGLRYLYNNGISLKVSGIIRPNEDALSPMLKGSIAYTDLLTRYVIEHTENAESVKAQLASPATDIFTGLPFRDTDGVLTDAQKEQGFRDYVSELDEKGKASVYIAIMSIPSEEYLEQAVSQTMQAVTRADMEAALLSIVSQQMGMSAESVQDFIASMSDADLEKMFREGVAEQLKAGYAAEVQAKLAGNTDAELAAALDLSMQAFTAADFVRYYDSVLTFSDSDYEINLTKLGCIDLENPSTINLYASSFANKDVIEEVIADYNKTVDDLSAISYTDYVGIMMSSITTIINAITYVLIAFVAISLVVSSIMIGVITLISVQERTKEIGILRAIGASKRDVSSMFNAETVIIGFGAGLLGIIVTYLLCIPINAIIHFLTKIPSLSAYLPLPVAGILILISVLLTLISGLIPSRSAAKKDPVVALRTE